MIVPEQPADLFLDLCAARDDVLNCLGQNDEAALDRLHRLTLLIRRDIEGRSDPEAVVEALAQRLFPRGDRVKCLTWEGRAASSMVGVLDTGYGNCVGNSVLLLAVETAYGVQFSMPEITGMQKLGDMRNLLVEKGAQA